MTDRATAALEAMSDAVLAIAAERSVDRVLQRIVDAARARVGALRGAGRAGRRGQLLAIHHLGHDRGGGGDNGAAAPHARPSGCDARVRRAAPNRGHPTRSAISRVVADRSPPDGLVPGCADRLPRRGPRRLLPHRQGGSARVHRGGRAADRDARRSRCDRDRERAALRAKQGAQRGRGTHPAGP